MATYPSQTPRSFRTHELAIELARQEYSVTLYVLKGDYDYAAYEKENNIKVKFLGDTYFFKYSHTKGIQQKIWSKILRKIFSNLLEFPLIELCRNAYQALKKEKDIDLLITVGRPYPLHWGVALYRTFNCKRLKKTVWVADCGDPYMGNKFHKKPFYFEYIEKSFCKKTDYISIPIQEAIDGYYPEFHNKIIVIPQGFNFNQTNVNIKFEKNPISTFIYAGSLYPNLRDPRPFLDYLIKEKQDFKFVVYTKDKYLLQDYIDKLNGKLKVLDYIPRKELILEMKKSDFLINLENPSAVQSPSKLIDYALANRPVLSINTNKEINTYIISEFLKGNYDNKLIIKDIEQYDIKNVARSFLQLL